MSDVVIHVENLWKEYRLGVISHHTLASDLQSWWARVHDREDPNSPVINNIMQRCDDDRFWALRDVSFEVKQGDTLGIIGRNGAGKSTLLKILSQVTAPTKGEVRYKGRIASLLEVGTGFHPELTGRENIFLNGAILGMSKVDIRNKLDEIVAFAEVDKFIDTPVKRYSSGMYVRLAFAIAAHLEPEILIVDEVLAVGDMQFQKKCLGKMQDVGKEGRTVLFVSHNTGAIRSLCRRAILLSQGSLVAAALAGEVIENYQNIMNHEKFSSTTAIGNEKNRRGIGTVRFTNIRLQNSTGINTHSFQMGETICFVLSFEVFKPTNNLYVAVDLRSGTTFEYITGVRHLVSNKKMDAGYNGAIAIEIPHNSLRPREFPLSFWLGNELGQAYDVADDVVPPLVITTDKELPELGFSPTDVPGFVDIESRLINRCE